MKKQSLLLPAVLACCVFVIGASRAQKPPLAPPGLTVDSGTCGGVFVGEEVPVYTGPRQSGGDWIRDFGVTVLRMRSYVREEDFEYTCDVLDAILPAMLELVGDPVALDTLTVELNDDVLQHYSCHSNSHTMGSIDPKEDTGVHSGWDNLVIHEFTHAFQGDLLCEGDVPSWLTEGMAEAARFFVGEAASEASGRVVRHRRFDKRMAVYDMYNGAGEQVLGGRWPIAYRFNFDILYQNAAGAVIVPALAQLGAGLDTPHPLARLTAELRAEKVIGPPYHIFAAVDRAWSAPVDGIMPPSRWMRSRAVTCPSVRDGVFVTLIPQFRYNGVNPPWVRIIQFERTGNQFVYDEPSGDIRFIGVFDTARKRVVEDTSPTVPDLDEGAYLIELAADDPYGGTITARSWMMVVDPMFVDDGLWDGVAVVFVDRDGRPVDIPPGSLSFNGRVVARVPGGVIASPYEGDLGSLTFERNGRVVGTVTATGPLPRMVALTVEDAAPPSVVSWKPYHPVRGGMVSLTFRQDRSSLPPGTGASVAAILYEMSGAVKTAVTMTPSSEWADVLTAELTVPDDLDDGVLVFFDGKSTHRGCWYWPCEMIRTYGKQEIPVPVVLFPYLSASASRSSGRIGGNSPTLYRR